MASDAGVDHSHNGETVPYKRDFDGVASCTFGNRYRYFVLLLGWICLTSVSSNMIALNFTLICMSPPVVANGTQVSRF